MKERMVAIAALNRDALRGQRRDGLTLELDYDRAVSDRVRRWVSLEQECCAFLSFVVEETDGLTRVRIVAPAAAAEAADMIFTQFAAASG